MQVNHPHLETRVAEDNRAGGASRRHSQGFCPLCGDSQRIEWLPKSDRLRYAGRARYQRAVAGSLQTSLRSTGWRMAPRISKEAEWHRGGGRLNRSQSREDSISCNWPICLLRSCWLPSSHLQFLYPPCYQLLCLIDRVRNAIHLLVSNTIRQQSRRFFQLLVPDFRSC